VIIVSALESIGNASIPLILRKSIIKIISNQ
jgi:hypothetical protein